MIAAVERHSSHPIATALCQAAAAAGITSGGPRGQVGRGEKQQVGRGEKALAPLKAAEKELEKQLQQLARLLEKRMISQDEYQANRESALQDFGDAQVFSSSTASSKADDLARRV